VCVVCVVCVVWCRVVSCVMCRVVSCGGTLAVHETHGLDSWERLVQRFNSNADKESGRIVDTICREEIDHVKKGLKWYHHHPRLFNTCVVFFF